MTTLPDAPVLAVPASRTGSFDASITGLAFSDAGVLGAGLGDGSMRLMAADGTIRAVQAHAGASLRLSLDVDGVAFLSGGDDGRLVRVNPDGTFGTLLDVPRRQIDALAVSRIGRVRAVATARQVRLLDSAGATLACSDEHPSTVSGLAFNARGKRLAVAHYGGVTLWWTASLGRVPVRLPWRGSQLDAVWSPDGAYLVTATQERELHAWHAASGRDMRMSGYQAKVRSMDWLAKPPVLLTSGANCITAWPFAGSGPQGKPPIEGAPGIGDAVTRVSASPRGALAGAGFEDGQVVVCDIAGSTDRTVRLRSADGDRITALAWSLDGTRLGVGTGGGRLTAYDLSAVARRA